MNGWLARLAERFPALAALTRNKLLTNVVIAGAVALVMATLAMFAVSNISFLTSADRFVQDWEIAFRSPPEPQDPNILILAVDEPTMQHFPYRSPLDRGFLASLLTALDAKHPKAIVLDYLFDQPTEKDKDDALRTALRNMKTPTVVSYFEANTSVSRDQVAYLNAFVPPKMRASA
ncbi:MAG: CHASE2 domain-containing protein, partial [Alphaproteobacteria bacterium]|nr:CHASE2 domain-containing protein [Alphaproteobacteria bacterium]